MRHGNTAGLGETWEEMDLFKINHPNTAPSPLHPQGGGSFWSPASSWKEKPRGSKAHLGEDINGTVTALHTPF